MLAVSIERHKTPLHGSSRQGRRAITGLSFFQRSFAPLLGAWRFPANTPTAAALAADAGGDFTRHSFEAYLTPVEIASLHGAA